MRCPEDTAACSRLFPGEALAIALLLLLCLQHPGLGQVSDDPAPAAGLEGAYFGQEPPGMIPTIFAPGIVSIPSYHEHSSPVFSRDGKEVYWSAQCLYDGTRNHRIFSSRLEDDHWTAPAILELTKSLHGGNPVLSPDNTRLYFHSCRPKPFEERFDNMHIWYAERTDAGWGVPVKLGEPVNSGYSDSDPYFLPDGTLYFSSNRPGGAGGTDIYRSSYVDGRFLEPENLGASINTEHDEYSPCLSADGSCILFSRFVEQPKGVQIFISFHLPDGSWTEAEPMGREVPLCRKARLPGLSPDGQYMFFCAYQGGDVDVYWVDARVIDLFRPDRPD